MKNQVTTQLCQHKTQDWKQRFNELSTLPKMPLSRNPDASIIVTSEFFDQSIHRVQKLEGQTPGTTLQVKLQLSSGC